MGCVSSTPHVDDTSRPVFHVWNVDDQGNFIKPGRIQVTDSDLVLRLRGESPVVWPLRSLRRYGFDSELFSFECGRRCATGPGIYAFKCRRAETLFNLLQECLQSSRAGSEQGLSSAQEHLEQEVNGSSLSGGGAVGGVEAGATSALLVSETDDEQLGGITESSPDPQPGSSTAAQPVVVTPDVVVPTAPQETVSSPTSPLMTAHSCSQRPHPGHPASRGVMPLRRATEYSSAPLPRCCTIGTCINATSLHYMNEEVFRHTTCGSCRSCSLNMCVVKPYVNSTIAVRDSLHRDHQGEYGNVLDPGGQPRQCLHCCCGLMQSTQLGCSADNCPLHFNNCVDQVTNYARLDDLLKQEKGGSRMKREKVSHHEQQPMQMPHFYMNIPSTPPKKWQSMGRSKSASWRSLPHFGKMSSLSRLAPKRSTSHFYANVTSHHPTEKRKAPQPQTRNSDSIKSEQDVNYIMLDLEPTPDSSTTVVSATPPPSAPSGSSPHSSPGRTPEGYATIDFDKTVALSNSTNQSSVDDDSVRRTRHNGSISSTSTQTS